MIRYSYVDALIANSQWRNRSLVSHFCNEIKWGAFLRENI